MIAAEDLMIGSIFWDDYGVYNVVTSLNCNKVGEAPNTVCAKHIKGGAVGNFSCNDIKAIPLTPDVLEMLGLKNEVGWQNNWFFCNGVSVNIHLGKYYWNDLSNAVEIKYLHQLQNICKVFGKDLKFKTT